MTFQMYSIYDYVLGAYEVPFAAANDGVASRYFVDLIREGSTSYHRNPKDYAVFNIGFFDSKTGEIFTSEPVNIFTGVDALTRIDSLKRGDSNV